MLGLYINSYARAANSFLVYPRDQKEIVLHIFSLFFSRLRLKKEFDDFKKHPEYNNFVREECISSSSSSDEDDEDGDTRPEAFSLSDHYRRAEEEDLEHVVPRGLWSGGKIKKKRENISKTV